MFKNGERIGHRYQIIGNSPLGGGGMGTVWLARDAHKGTKVALKTLRYEELLIQVIEENRMTAHEVLSFGKSLRNLFLREARALTKLGAHSNIAAVLDFGVCTTEDEDVATTIYYIVLEYIEGEGGSSQDATSIVGGEDILLCLKVALAICRAISYAHAFNIIHRDITPRNILLGKNGVVKVTDFGLAKILDEGSKDFTVPWAGTPRFKAPEQTAANPTTNEMTDIYQFGATLYYIFTGRYAEVTDIPGKPKGPVAPIKLNNKIPLLLSDLIMRMISKDGSARPDLAQIEDVLQETEYRIKQPMIDTFRVWQQPVMRIRSALKERVKEEIDSLQDIANLIPSRNKKPVWYATVLLRPLIEEDGKKRLADSFTLIYFVEFTRDKITAQADWDNNPALIHTPLAIDKCCAGLPIRWQTEHKSWSQQYGNEFWRMSPSHSRPAPEYMILYDVQKARFDADTRPNLVYANYATADAVPGWERSVGWGLVDVKTGELKPMSQKIETEILVPIFSMAAGNTHEDKNEVLGVVNFEWDEPFSFDERQQMAKEITHHIHERNVLGITRFTCDVLYNVTAPDSSK